MSDRHRRHDPGAEVWIGVRTPGAEVPQGADAIRAALQGHGATLVEAEPHADRDLLGVHDAALLEYLADAWRRWDAAGLPDESGQDRVVSRVFAPPGVTAGRPRAEAGYDLDPTGTAHGETLAGVQQGLARA